MLAPSTGRMAIAALTADPEFEHSIKATFGANAQIDLTLVSGTLAGREDKLDFAGARVVVLDIDASQDAEINALQRLMLHASNWPPVIVVTQKFDQDLARVRCRFAQSCPAQRLLLS